MRDVDLLFSMAVYYGLTFNAARIKIGFSSNPVTRCKNLGLRLLATEPGARLAEQLRHERFASDRLKGEYFRPSERLRAHIGTLDPSADWVPFEPFVKADVRVPTDDELAKTYNLEPFRKVYNDTMKKIRTYTVYSDSGRIVLRAPSST